MIIGMGFGSSIVDIVDALRTMQDEEQNKIKDYGDIAKVLESNPLLGALANHLLSSLYEKVLGELDRRMVPPDSELFTIEQASALMGRTVIAARKLRIRGKLVPVPQRINGRIMFTKEAIVKAMVSQVASPLPSQLDLVPGKDPVG
jgi:hypothetical protein